MFMKIIGVTNCRKCLRPLDYDENEICTECKNLQEKEQKEKEKILSIFYNMNQYEQKALEEFIHKIGKDYKREETEKEIERLQKELEN